MALTQDIVDTFKGPGRVHARFLAQGRNEVRVLLFVIIAGIMMCIAAAPYQAREAQLNTEVPMMARMYWSAFLFVFVMPILLYAVAALAWVPARVARSGVSGYQIRFTLVWALLAVTPITLLLGLVAGFIGPGVQLQVTGILWAIVFFWFWIAGLTAATRVQK